MFSQKFGKIISASIVFYLISLGLMGVLILEGFLNTGNASAATIIVDKNGNGDYTTIQEAIDNASFGDTIYVWAGVYNETLEIYNGISLIGNGSANTTIDASDSWWGATIDIAGNYVKISGFNLMNSTWTGINIGFCSDVHIFNNTISNNDNSGIEIYDSINITIENNNIIQNSYTGIMVSSSQWCNILNNVISNTEEGVSIDVSENIMLSNNTFIGCGVLIRSNSWSNYLEDWTSHNIDNKNTVNGKPLIYWVNRNSGKIPVGAGEIIIANCSNIIVDAQNCSYTSAGIVIGISDKINVNNCIFNFNANGILVQQSNNVTLTNNNISSNNNYGVYLAQSSMNVLSNNTCNFNSYDGICLDMSCNKNYISNNTCNHNQDVGLFASLCNDNSIVDNKFNNNWFDGLFMGWQCQFNDIVNNEMLENNNTGLYMGSASNNTIVGNNMSKNNYGIGLGWDCLRNNFFDNSITNNLKTGVELNPSCDYNKFHHNNFISNTNQKSCPTGTNNKWSMNFEGNYWSDYTGVDDGSNDRIPGDLIGDTNLPHPGIDFDDFPFVRAYGWQYPGVPMLKEPGDLDSDGNYTITWVYRNRAIGYILEEDENEIFDSPIEIYNDSDVTCEISNKSESTYYYRLKMYTHWYQSAWSEIVNITVDYLPTVPVNFIVSADPKGNALNLSWDMNSEDINCYELFYKTNGMQEFDLLVNLSYPIHTYSHIGIIDGQTYYYKILSKDKYWQESPFSEIISAEPQDTLAPASPTNLNAEAISDTEIKLTWTANSEDDLSGYFIYMQDSMNDIAGEYKLTNTVPKNNSYCVISGLNEQVTYLFKIKAFDEVPNNSTFSNLATATTPDLTHPLVPTGVKVSNQTHNSLTLSWDTNSENDIIGYIVFRSKSESDNYYNITGIINDTEYVDSGLDEATVYYYCLKAVDDAELESMLSEPVIGQTLLGPKAPTISNPVDDFELEEDTVDDSTISLFDWFEDINDDLLIFRCVGQTHINVTIDQITGVVILKPQKDWNGNETLIFYANDSVFEIYDSVMVIVTAVNDDPGEAKIINPVDGLKIKADETLNFIGECSDPDSPYGDVLTFSWSSSISGILGTGNELNDIVLEPGEHVITLEVSDKEGKKANADINITVQKKSIEKETGSESGELYIYITTGVIIIILVLFILYMLIRRKREPQNKKDEEDLEMEE